MMNKIKEQHQQQPQPKENYNLQLYAETSNDSNRENCDSLDVINNESTCTEASFPLNKNIKLETGNFRISNFHFQKYQYSYLHWLI